MTEEVKVARRQRRAQRQAEEAEAKKTYWVQIRMFPIWLRILLILAIFGGAAVAGLMVGYGILGDGTPSDALKWETYQHLLDIKDGK
ncbi:DNA-directed RNA polymerase subunit beta [Psychrobacillus sp.]|uniref:DNA-directed RNA polymerase subunit beta n=1 Tax=Psychrobacillus sp. TaxID=1871623 RepID=UPI0028BEA273|nr:DNA-directed RNA polymerase subunit beta [Psychrobacillus sp.]